MYDQNFLQRSTRNFKTCRLKLWRKTQAQWCLNKQLTKLKRTCMSLFLSLYLSICRCIVFFDFPERMCIQQSLSLSLLHLQTVWIQIRPEWNSGENVKSILKVLQAIRIMENIDCPTLSYKSRCAG